MYSAYAAPSTLRWGNRHITSAEGVQQGDPLGPLLFCLVLHQHGLHLDSAFKAIYVDDVTLGGDLQDLLHNIQVIRDADALGLTLNASKCEIISTDMMTCGTLLVALPGAQLIPLSQAQLLGSPIGDDSCISAVLSGKVEELRSV